MFLLQIVGDGNNPTAWELFTNISACW